MEPFVKVFGNITVDKIALLIAAIFFLWKIYKKVEDYFSKRALSEAEREKKIQDILDQAQMYPKWHEQSIQYQKKYAEEIDSLRETQKEIITKLDDAEKKRKKTKRINHKVF